MPNTQPSQDAVELLEADHETVKKLFEEFKNAQDDRKADLVAQICQELKVHMQIEEELFYPAVKAALDDHELVPEGKVEHDSVKALMVKVEGAAPGGDEYDAQVHVMGELIEHHVKEEEEEMFPAARKSKKVDLKALGERMLARKEELSAAHA
jgi:hemerythrin superfamily protein